jgi:hypothetical protein
LPGVKNLELITILIAYIQEKVMFNIMTDCKEIN